MALHFSLKSNSEEIGYFSAVRRNPLPGDNVYMYEVDTELNGEKHKLFVSHCYTDGAFKLIEKALVLLSEG